MQFRVQHELRRVLFTQLLHSLFNVGYGVLRIAAITETTPPKQLEALWLFRLGHSAVTTWHGFVHCREKTADTETT